MTKGTVKFYNEQKGFGFIEPEDGGKDVFVHATALERAGISRLVEGQKVSLTPSKTAAAARPRWARSRPCSPHQDKRGLGKIRAAPFGERLVGFRQGTLRVLYVAWKLARRRAFGLAERRRIGALRFRRAARQRVVLAIVETPDLPAVESLLIDFEIGAQQRLRGQFLDGEVNRLRGSLEPLVGDAAGAALPASGWIQLRQRGVIECSSSRSTFRPALSPRGWPKYFLIQWMLNYTPNIGA